MKKYLPTALAVFIAFVFIQSLFFKFTGSEETEIIFSTVGTWMADIGLPASLARGFSAYGGTVIGTAELAASILVLIAGTRFWGALISLIAMSGAIFFHLFTPLGVNRVIDAAGNTDNGVLFIMACGVWLSSIVLLYLERQQFQTLFGHGANQTMPQN